MTFDWRKARGERIKPYEKALLFLLAKEVDSRFEHPHIVNIGVSWGASVHCLYNGAPSAYHLAVDIDLATRPMNRSDLVPTVTFVEADSGVLGLSANLAHLLFIDGGHDYNTVKGDILSWVPHIPVGGIVAFHDYDPEPRDRRRLEGVKRAVNMWYYRTQEHDRWAMYPIVESIATFERVK